VADKRALVIGGGVGGLAVGSYLLMNGFSVRLLEQNSQLGGVMATWRREGYRFDGATNYLAGSSPRLNAHRILGEVLDLDRIEFYDYPEFICIEHKSGEVFHVYTDAERLRAEMLRIAPEDRSLIDQLVDAVVELGGYDLPFEQAPETFGVLDAISFLKRNYSLLKFRRKWGGITIAALASRFNNPLMREMFVQIFPHHEHFAVMAPLAPLAWMNRRAAGYPMGGSARITELMRERFSDLGGEVELDTPVSRIDVERGVAVGVTCADGNARRADVVVSAADLHATVFDLLGGRFVGRKLARRFERYRAFTALVQVSLGIARTFDGEPEKLNLPLPDPLPLGDHTARDMMVRILSFDPSFAPVGKTAVIAQLRTEDYQSWCDLRASDRETYQLEKQRVGGAVIAALEARFGGVAAKVEVVDVATPATYIRYTGLWQGAHQGWAPIPGVIGRPQPKQLEGLRNLYLAGHWLSPAGGIPAVVAIGRQVTQIVCMHQGRPFTVAG
jgi:phytoene dehydrogenase-like protein